MTAFADPSVLPSISVFEHPPPPRPCPQPDPHVCREKKWIPFINDELGGSNPESVVVGHSSGAVAALRLAERQKLKGIIVVAGYDSDLGDANERASGYFDRPFDWAWTSTLPLLAESSLYKAS